MNYTIIHPNEDREGTPKENIFLALDENGGYLAHAYVYPFENHHVSYAYPQNIFFMVECTLDNEVGKAIREELYTHCFTRALELKNELWPHETVRFYTGLLKGNDDGMTFFLQKGFQDNDGTVQMERELNLFTPRIDCTVKKVFQRTMDGKEEQEAFIKRRNRYFLQSLDLDGFKNLYSQPGFAVFQIYDDDKLLGEALVYEKESMGMLELFYIIPESRGGNTANILMEQTLAYFKKRGLEKVRLEVWERNKRALCFYSRFGFKITGERSESYPGMDL